MIWFVLGYVNWFTKVQTFHLNFIVYGRIPEFFDKELFKIDLKSSGQQLNNYSMEPVFAMWSNPFSEMNFIRIKKQAWPISAMPALHSDYFNC